METQHRKSGWRAILLRAEKMREGEGNRRGTGGERGYTTRKLGCRAILIRGEK